MANVWHSARARVVTALMAAPALDGCGGTATGTSTATGSAASGSTATSPSWAMAVGPTAAVTHKDLSITASRASFALTRYTFTSQNKASTSQNKASLPHSRNVAGPGLDTVARPAISPGQSGMLMVTLQKGFCGLGCPVPGHEDKSMSLTIEAG
jgi:uncharacterized cupredoxin-like copper-binding protein